MYIYRSVFRVYIHRHVLELCFPYLCLFIDICGYTFVFYSTYVQLEIDVFMCMLQVTMLFRAHQSNFISINMKYCFCLF